MDDRTRAPGERRGLLRRFGGRAIACCGVGQAHDRKALNGRERIRAVRGTSVATRFSRCEAEARGLAGGERAALSPARKGAPSKGPTALPHCRRRSWLWRSWPGTLGTLPWPATGGERSGTSCCARGRPASSRRLRAAGGEVELGKALATSASRGRASWGGWGRARHFAVCLPRTPAIIRGSSATPVGPAEDAITCRRTVGRLLGGGWRADLGSAHLAGAGGPSRATYGHPHRRSREGLWRRGGLGAAAGNHRD